MSIIIKNPVVTRVEELVGEYIFPTDTTVRVQSCDGSQKIWASLRKATGQTTQEWFM